MEWLGDGPHRGQVIQLTQPVGQYHDDNFRQLERLDSDEHGLTFRQHSKNYMGYSFYRSKDPTNSIKSTEGKKLQRKTRSHPLEPPLISSRYSNQNHVSQHTYKFSYKTKAAHIFFTSDCLTSEKYCNRMGRFRYT